MLTVISPAKKLNLEPNMKILQTKPTFKAEANNLAATVSKLSTVEQQKLMSISEKLAELKEITKSQLVEITTNNFNKLFS